MCCSSHHKSIHSTSPSLPSSLFSLITPIGTPRSIRFGLGYGGDTASALAEALQGMTLSIDDAIAARLAQYNATPAVGPTYQRLLNKAVSIMRVNALSPEGGIVQRWSTPDRVPHRWMWLWDSCYHSMAINELQVPRPGCLAGAAPEPGHNIGWEYLKSVLDAAGPDGAISIERTPTSVGTKVTQTQPPLLAWAVWENFLVANTTDPEKALARLAYAFPRLVGYINWDRRERGDPTGKTPLLVWTKGTESGMDNSQRFDAVDIPRMLAVDFSVFLARECMHLASIATSLGNHSAATEWAGIAGEVSAAIHQHLWDEATGLYYDADVHTGLKTVKAVTAFLPLWLSDIPSDRVAKLVANLQQPSVGT